MSKHSRRRRIQSPSSAVPIPGETVHAQPAAGAWFSGYDGAAPSTSRGSVFWPTLDTRVELDSYSRQEIIRKIRWGYANVGLIKGFIKNAADFIGWLSPQAATNDKTWNEQAEAIFRDQTGHAEAFDIAGKFNFHTAQSVLSRTALKDGEFLTVLTEAKNGAARHAFYETQQLCNPPNAGPNWIDGVYIKGGRHLGYGLKDPETDKVVFIDARDAIYSGEFDSCGHHRVIPPLAHAVNHSLDIVEVWGFTKKAIKTSALFGAVRERTNSSVPASRQGLAGSSSTTTDPNTGQQFESSSVFDSGQIPRLDGETLRILHDQRPHPNQRDFIGDLVRDMALGYGLPPEVIWGIYKITGPGIRFVMDHAATWISRRQENLLRPWATIIWVRTIAKEIKRGRLPMPSDPRWWAVKFIPQRDMTIDRGREGTHKLKEIEAGLGTMARYSQQMYGSSWEDDVRQIIREAQFRHEECERAGIPYELVFPRATQPATPPAPIPLDNPDDLDPATPAEPIDPSSPDY